MDEVRKYLFEHRDELDTEKPPHPQVWKHIRQKTQVVKKPVVSLIVKWTAAAAILVAASLLVYQLQRPVKPADTTLSATDTPKTGNRPELIGQVDTSGGIASVPENETFIGDQPGDKKTSETSTNADNQEIAQKDKATPNTKIASPLQAVEDNYATIINYQLKKLEKTPIYTESPGYFHVFKKQWLDLEKDERKVKQDVRLYGLSDHMMDRLIRHYQQKLWLLKELQSEINKMNVRAQQHPDIQRTNPAYLKL